MKPVRDSSQLKNLVIIFEFWYFFQEGWQSRTQSGHRQRKISNSFPQTGIHVNHQAASDLNFLRAVALEAAVLDVNHAIIGQS